MTTRLLTEPQFEPSAVAPEPTVVPRRPVERLSRTTSEPVPVRPYDGPIYETGRATGQVISEYLRSTGGKPLPTFPSEGDGALPPGLNPTKPTAMTPIDYGHPATRCKHEREDCEDCGTTARRDFAHTTRGGRGVVGALSKKR